MVLQKGEIALLTGCLRREAKEMSNIQDVFSVIARSFLLHKPKLDLLSLDLADVSAGCV